MAFATKAFENERRLVQHLQSHGLMDLSGVAAGPSARGTDFHLNVKGKKYSGEYKQDIHAGMGQLEVRHDPKGKKGSQWAPSAKAAGTALVKHWHDAVATIKNKKIPYGKHVNTSWGKPSSEYEKAIKSHHSVYSDWGPPHAMIGHYQDRGVHYVQMGNELFHTNKDVAGLGTMHLKDSGIETRFRTRVKGRGHDKKTGKMKFGFLTTIEARRQKGAKTSPASLYSPHTLHRISQINRVGP